MYYELHIALRYLFRGSGSRRLSLIGVGAGVAAIALGIYLVLASGGSSAVGVILLGSGMLMTTVFALLSVFSVLMTVSVFGVVLGVASLIVVLSVTTGFQQQFREKVLGVNAHVIIMKNTLDFSEYREVENTARDIDPEVIAVQPFIFREMLVTRGQGELSGGVAIKGVDPARVTQVLDLQKHMEEGSVASLAVEPEEGKPAAIILGRELAYKLKAELGDELTVVEPLSNFDLDTWTITGAAPKTRKFVVSGIFYSGFDEYDRRLMYISLKEAQELWGQGDQVLGVELKVMNVDRAKEIADRLEDVLGPEYGVQDWHELNRNLFTALTLQKIALLTTLTLIIIVATFNVVSSLIMTTIKKTREIAILKSMGATSTSIGRIFQTIGLTIGVIGTSVGLIIGLTLCSLVSEYGYRLDPKVYLIDRLPISVNPWEVVLVAALTMVICGVVTLFPSTMASMLRPVEGLRHD
jgi:lipoprotein-releasing system permease protein